LIIITECEEDKSIPDLHNEQNSVQMQLQFLGSDNNCGRNINQNYLISNFSTALIVINLHWQLSFGRDTKIADFDQQFSDSQNCKYVQVYWRCHTHAKSSLEFLL